MLETCDCGSLWLGRTKRNDLMAKLLAEDLYSDKLLNNPCSVYKQIRDLGSAVWLPKRRLWAIGRFDDVRLALRSDAALISGNGVAANNLVNSQHAPIVLTSDADTHNRRRSVLVRPILPSPLKVLRLGGRADCLAFVERRSIRCHVFIRSSSSSERRGRTRWAKQGRTKKHAAVGGRHF